ncbi:hypothetical protein [Streptomyces sp. NPDC000888]
MGRGRGAGPDPAARPGPHAAGREAVRGQRAQLALALGIAKWPELLIPDEPVAALDPLARWEFMQDLLEAVAEQW